MTSSSGTNRCGPTGTNRLKIGGTFTRAKCSLPVLRVAHQHGQVQRQPGDVGERVRRVDGQRRQHREDPVAEQRLAGLLLVAVEVRPAQQLDLLLGERGDELVAEQLRVALHEVARRTPDLLQHLARHQAGRGGYGDPGGDPPLQAGHPHHEELVEVGGEDRQEPDPFEQRQVRVLGQLEHPGVEVQPGQLAVEEPVGGQVLGVERRTAARCRTARPARRPGDGPPRSCLHRDTTR